MAQDCTDLVV